MGWRGYGGKNVHNQCGCIKRMKKNGHKLRGEKNQIRYLLDGPGQLNDLLL